MTQRQPRPDVEEPRLTGWGYREDIKYTGSPEAELLNAFLRPGFWVHAYQPVRTRETPLMLQLNYDVDRDGLPQLQHLVIEPGDYDYGISASDLRGIRLGELHAKVMAVLQSGKQSDWSGLGPEYDPPMPPQGWVKEFRDKPRPGRAGRDDEWYANLAREYVQSGSRTPVKDLAEQYHLSRSQIASLLNEARRRGVLTPGTRGKAGGQLTQYGRRLLDGTR